MLKWSIGSAVCALALGIFGFSDGIGETTPWHGLARMVCVGLVFTTILFALGHFDKNAEASS